MLTHFAEFLVDMAARRPDEALFTFLYGEGEEQAVSAAELHRDARILAGALRERGVSAGDIVPLVFDHGYDLVAAFWGAIYLGAVPTILPYVSRDTRSKNYVEQVRRLVRFTGAPNVVTMREIEETLADGLADTGCRLIALGADTFAGIEDDSEAWRLRSPSTPPYIQFSSGSTGAPKGVVLSQSAILHFMRQHAGISAARPSDVMVGWLPLYHDMGLSNQVVLPLFAGHACVMMSPASWLSEPQRLFHAIHRHHGTVTWMPNFAYSYCTRRIRDEQIQGVDLSTWRLLGNASEPIFLRDLEQFADRFAAYGLQREALTVSYGLAEHVAAVTHTVDGRSPDVDWVRQADLADGRAVPAEPRSADSRPIVSCGAPLGGVRLRIADTDGSELPERRLGEILVQSQSLFDGYYADPEETAAALRDGWLHTGDLGYLAGGELYVCGRKKDLIIVGGRNLHPNHLEEVAARVLGAHCRFAAAFGVPNPRRGTETPVLVCEMRELPDEETRLRVRDEIRERLQSELGVFVGNVHLVGGGWILKTTSGKINRAANRERYLAETRAPWLAESTPEASAPLEIEPRSTELRLLRLWESLFERRGIAVDDDFFALGGDSLLAAQLAVGIEEEFGRSLPATALLDSSTIAELARLLDRPAAAMTRATLVALRPARARSRRPKFFCVHGVGGGVVDYRALSQALGPEQPFYGLQARGLDGESPVDSDIGQMARHYVEVLRDEQASGPYHLGGYCFGGVVAFEMAHQLRAAGEEVPLVAILEGYAPRRAANSSLASRCLYAVDIARGLPYWLGDYLRLEGMALRARNRRLLRMVKAKGRRLLGHQAEVGAQEFLDGAQSQPARIQKVLTAHVMAMRDYEPPIFDGRVVLFRTRQRPLRAPSWDMGWGDVARAPVEVQLIAGAHATILQPPHVRVLAEKLEPFLRPA